MEEPQTAKPAVCATRHFVLILCIHKHSRFVPAILQSTGGGVETLGSPPPPSGLRPARDGRGRIWVSHSSTTICPPAHLPTCPYFCTPRLLDCTWRQKPQAGTTDENKRGLSGIAYSAGPERLVEPYRTILAYSTPFVKCQRSQPLRWRLARPRLLGSESGRACLGHARAISLQGRIHRDKSIATYAPPAAPYPLQLSPSPKP
jgi:hypothetical protein